MPEKMDLFEAIYSQRAIRKFKPDPVPDELIRDLLEAATKSPSGANRQGWKFIVIRDADLKRELGGYYRRSWEVVYGAQASAPPPIHPRVKASAAYLAEHIHEAPVLVLFCLEHDGSPSSMGRGGSIYPAVQNFLLAAVGLGLGSVLTSLHKRFEEEVKGLLGIPDNVETAALLPVGFPAEGERYGPTRRDPVEQVTYWDRWGSGASAA